jgi:hypothetical protein
VAVQYTRAHPGNRLDDDGFYFSAPADRYIRLGEGDPSSPQTFLTFIPSDAEQLYGAAAWSAGGQLNGSQGMLNLGWRTCSDYTTNVRWHRALGTRISYYWNLSPDQNSTPDITSNDLKTSDLINGLAPCKNLTDIWWMWLNEKTGNGPLNAAAQFATSAHMGGQNDPVVHQQGVEYDSVVLFKTVTKNPAMATPVNFASGTKIALQADSGEWMTRCRGCQTTVNNSSPDTIVLMPGDVNAFSTFKVEPVDAAHGVYRLQADSGGVLSICNKCIVGGSVDDFVLVSQRGNTPNPFAELQFIAQADGKFGLIGKDGNWVSRCRGCSPGVAKGVSDEVTAHVPAHKEIAAPGPAEWTVRVVP